MERRRYARYPVSWYVRLWLDEGSFVGARAVDASVHGMRIALTDESAPRGLEVGHPRRVEIFHPDAESAVTRVGEVRHVGHQGIGLYIREPLPVDLIADFPDSQTDSMKEVRDPAGAESL